MRVAGEILHSLQMLGGIAALEIERVLGSRGSVSAKEGFIDALYEIRQITYKSDGEEPETVTT